MATNRCTPGQPTSEIGHSKLVSAGPVAKEAAIRAVEIDDALPEAQALLGTMLGIADFDWRAAGLAFRRALELDVEGILACADGSLEECDPMTVMNLLQEPMLDPLRSDERYSALLRKINLQC